MAEEPHAVTRGPGATRRLALLSLATATGAAAIYLFTVGTPAGQLIGELILGGRPPAIEQVTAAEGVLEILSRSTLALGTIVVVAIALVQGRPRLAGAALIVVLGANVTTQLLKPALLAWRRGSESVGPRTARLGGVGAGTLIAVGGCLFALGALAYLVAALDPLEVLLHLAERGGSPALFAIGLVIVVGATFFTIGALGLALRDVRLDPRRQERRGPRLRDQALGPE